MRDLLDGTKALLGWREWMGNRWDLIGSFQRKMSYELLERFVIIFLMSFQERIMVL